MRPPLELQGIRLTSAELLRLQRLAGNQAVVRLLRRLRRAEENQAATAKVEKIPKGGQG